MSIQRLWRPLIAMERNRRSFSSEYAQAAYDTALAHQTGAFEAIRALGGAYHPVDPATGALRDEATVQAELATAMATLDAAAEAVDLSERRRKLLDKARRVLPKMAATIGFFYAELSRQLAALALGAEVRAYATAVLMPAAYLARLAARASSRAERTTLLATRKRILQAAPPVE